MFDQMSALEGWSDKCQLQPHTNQLQELSGSLEYKPRLQRIKLSKQFEETQHYGANRYNTEERCPRKLYTNRATRGLSVEAIEFAFQPPIGELSPKKNYQHSPKQKRGKHFQDPKLFIQSVALDLRHHSPKQCALRNKLNKLVPILCQTKRVKVNNRVITYTHRSPITQVSQILQLLQNQHK